MGACTHFQAGAQGLPEAKAIWQRWRPPSAARTAATNGNVDQSLQNEAALYHTHSAQLWGPDKRGDPNNFWICGPGHAVL